jgi:hypothetical protein
MRIDPLALRRFGLIPPAPKPSARLPVVEDHA